ncbi:hypothetical protein H6P81_004047 [Aristolochia fimbriata]|uniref:Bet v I/Major latex protein domain-containing protein n=1 Tax=Aristolochia fimbriata TaxID=158543 RepID=A0AAV7FET4_ARIFI|nr:hypothetical protein H6P81_004047 [Aristolochia fimbriata]
MVAGSYTEVSVSPVATARLWKASADVPTLIPKLMPNVVTSIELVKGNGGVGSVKQFNFGEALKDVKYVKDRIDVLDHENKVYKYTIVEGGQIGKKLKSTSFEVKMEPTSEGGTKTTMKMDYETLGDTPLSDQELKKMVANVAAMSKAIEDHLQANPELYA